MYAIDIHLFDTRTCEVNLCTHTISTCCFAYRAKSAIIYHNNPSLSEAVCFTLLEVCAAEKAFEGHIHQSGITRIN